MRNSGILIGDKLKYLCLHNPRNNKVYGVDHRDFADLIKDMFEGKYKIFSYPEDCKSDTDRQQERRNKQGTITAHIDNKSGCDIEYIKKYCHFFGCTSDYLLGIADRPTKYQTDINKKTGLSDDAIKNLVADSEIQLVCNSLLATNNIKNLIEYIELTIEYEHNNNYILNHIFKDIQTTKNKKLYGISLENFKKFQDTLKYGEQSDKDNTASVCLDMLLHDKDLMDYFKNKAVQTFKDKANHDISITTWGQILQNALDTNNKAMADFAEQQILAISNKKKNKDKTT
jgi:hypothetical protein